MSMELLMQYVMYMLAGIGVLAFFVSVVVQVVKEMPGLNKSSKNNGADSSCSDRNRGGAQRGRLEDGIVCFCCCRHCKYLN